MSNRQTIGLHATNSSPPYDQSQSPLFTTLPLDIRRQIYLQLWLDCGLTQHIYTFSKNSYLQSYACILDDNEWDKDPKPPAEEDSSSSSSTGTPEPGPQLVPDGHLPAADEQQPQPYDDPGDIDGAIQDILTQGPEGLTDDQQQQPDTPWCHHRPCFERWIGKWDRSFSRAYSANYRGGSPHGGARAQRGRDGDRLRASPLLLPLLVCRRMYQEAGESLFSSVRFSFPLEALERFLSDVPRGLTERIQFVDVVTCTLLLYESPPPLDKRVQILCKTLKDSFPLLTELRLTLHPTRLRVPIPPAEAFAPFYDLAADLGNLRKFDLMLPCQCEKDCPVGYGETPDFLRDAPFKAVLVPQGWHDTGHCDPFISP